jgi:hypothetical protein
MSGQIQALATSLPRKVPCSTCSIGSWLGAEASLYAVEKREISCACQELSPDSLVVQLRVWLIYWLSYQSFIYYLFFKVNEVEVDQSLGMQSGVMTALSVVGGLDSRPRIGGLVMAEGLGLGEF